MKKTIFALLFFFTAAGASAQEPGYFYNPVIRGDVADPTMIRFGDAYYAAGTSSEWAPFYPVFKSTDLVNWTQTGHVFNEKPAWTSNSFWAPELFVNPTNGRVYCYYTARQASTGISYIGVASAKSPEQKFTDHGPLVEYGTESIDAFVYNDDGQLYISWKAYGLDKRPVEILGSKLSADGLKLEGDPFTLLVDDKMIGMEGQYHFKKGDYYYIVYSALGCCGPKSDYEVYVARSKDFTGPYEKFDGNPILHGGAGDFMSCGHGTAVELPDGRMFYLCHAYAAGNGYFLGRQPILQEMFVNADGWVEFKTGRLAVAKQPVPFAGTVQKPVTGFYDDFRKAKPEWSWNYPYSDIIKANWKNRLSLSGRMKPDRHNGTAICVRPSALGYTFETRVINSNPSVKGLTMYGDDRNLVVWGVHSGKLILKVIDNGVETTLYESRMGNYGTPWLRVAVESGSVLTFYYSINGVEWTQLADHIVDRRDLARWDRVARPGLIQIGSEDAPAEFAYFKLENK